MPDPLHDPNTDAPGPRLVGLSCDHPGGCDADIRCDVLARSFAEALPALIAHGRANGWGVTDDGRIAHCPAHTPSLLGVPTGEAPA